CSDSGEAIVDFAVADVEELDLVVRELDVVVIRGVVRIGEADQPAGDDNEAVVVAVDVLGERLAGRQRQVPDADPLVLEQDTGAHLCGWFSGHAFLLSCSASMVSRTVVVTLGLTTVLIHGTTCVLHSPWARTHHVTTNRLR